MELLYGGAPNPDAPVSENPSCVYVRIPVEGPTVPEGPLKILWSSLKLGRTSQETIKKATEADIKMGP